jgi:diguanylate cyclase (GGDEF)-like protein
MGSVRDVHDVIVRHPAREWIDTDEAHPAEDAAAVLSSALAQVAELRTAVEASSARSAIDASAGATLNEKLLGLRVRLLRLTTLVAEAAHCAYHDELTGLPNRFLLLDRLRQAVAQAARQGRKLAVILLDLNGFKAVNDRFGHQAGDKLLVHVAELLKGAVRESDTVCRYGGDEFVIMLPEVSDGAAVAAVLEKIGATLTTPVALDGQLTQASASMGVAIYPADGDDCRELIRRADLAMYRAKRSCEPAPARVEH